MYMSVCLLCPMFRIVRRLSCSTAHKISKPWVSRSSEEAADLAETLVMHLAGRDSEKYRFPQIPAAATTVEFNPYGFTTDLNQHVPNFHWTRASCQGAGTE